MTALLVVIIGAHFTGSDYKRAHLFDSCLLHVLIHSLRLSTDYADYTEKY
jgi:hypothetical protein